MNLSFIRILIFHLTMSKHLVQALPSVHVHLQVSNSKLVNVDNPSILLVYISIECLVVLIEYFMIKGNHTVTVQQTAELQICLQGHIFLGNSILPDDIS